jgi:hypothetical protein
MNEKSSCPVLRGRDGGNIILLLDHQVAVTTSTGKGLIVTGRGIRTIKRQYNKTHGQLARLQSRCRKGSKRWRRLQYTKARERGRKERRVRDLRHKGAWQVVDFCRAAGVQTLYVGDPHGVRNENKGRYHNQRMGQWEYGKDKRALCHALFHPLHSREQLEGRLLSHRAYPRPKGRGDHSMLGKR